ncbi:hypothetical protein D3C71_2190260 [compost metagenome]
MFPHGQAGPGLPRVGGVRGKVLGTDPGQGAQLLRGGLGAVKVQQDFPEALADGDGGVGCGVDAAGNG